MSITDAIGKRLDKPPIEKEYGSIYNEYFIGVLSQQIATAKGDDGTNYDVSLLPNGMITVRSDKSKQTWTLSVRTMLRMAISDGVNEPQDFEEYSEEPNTDN
jgi:hypothetical protein